ncbi:hypothetical protein BJ165DRAFT_802928 [Panaeolus papilionaceus]|nr:hypothetical protein BJ165DRAFT_802928 [Panaeolus papilionaceus]
MFGSLVIVLPTVHEGGSLLFRHNAQQWEFDSAAAVSVDPCTAAFTAFFSDVEHEVTPIISGYRATITYNLYFGTATDPAPAAKTHVSTRLREQFKKLLKNPCFLPKGGYIGVHLLHKYPVDSRDRYVKLKDFEKYLKGVDGDILTLFREFRLDANLKMLYKEQDGRGHCLANTIIDFDELENDAHWAKEEKALPIERYIYGEWEAQAIISASEDGRWDGMESDEGNQRKYSPIFWLRGDVDVRPNHKERCYTYTAGGQYLYGNEADWSVYQELALVAWLGPVHQRETYVPKSPSK